MFCQFRNDCFVDINTVRRLRACTFDRDDIAISLSQRTLLVDSMSTFFRAHPEFLVAPRSPDARSAASHGAVIGDLHENLWRPVRQNEKTLKTVAFYLPQFHAIPENDEWWGDGLHRVGQCSSCPPQFDGHDHPRVPSCWASTTSPTPRSGPAVGTGSRPTASMPSACTSTGSTVSGCSRSPSTSWREHPDLLPYCLSWANESWTRRWDGKEQEVLAAQNYEPGFARGLFDDLLPHFRCAALPAARGPPGAGGAPYRPDPRRQRVRSRHERLRDGGRLRRALPRGIRDEARPEQRRLRLRRGRRIPAGRVQHPRVGAGPARCRARRRAFEVACCPIRNSHAPTRPGPLRTSSATAASCQGGTTRRAGAHARPSTSARRRRFTLSGSARARTQERRERGSARTRFHQRLERVGRRCLPRAGRHHGDAYLKATVAGAEPVASCGEGADRASPTRPRA